MPSAAELDAAIAAEESRLAELDQLSDAARGRLVELRTASERALREVEGERTSLGSAAVWPAERKVALFASLFRGREDVFPLRWENKGKGCSGWAPRCSNEWVRGVCAKPRVRCGECSHQAFLAPVDGQLLAHLQGRQVMGVYPLLADDTCWLLAIDLDGASWRSDVRLRPKVSKSLGRRWATSRLHYLHTVSSLPMKCFRGGLWLR